VVINSLRRPQQTTTHLLSAPAPHLRLYMCLYTDIVTVRTSLPPYPKPPAVPLPLPLPLSAVVLASEVEWKRAQPLVSATTCHGILRVRAHERERERARESERERERAHARERESERRTQDLVSGTTCHDGFRERESLEISIRSDT